jgi:uncharacterized protein|uniref:Uncharacterized protein n=1 Tax=viral metagenome TaxID=1070528 RepID=A0A6C0IXF0_9ZZZZ
MNHTSPNLHELVYDNNTQKVSKFLKSIDSPENIINSHNELGKTPLHIAVKNNNQDIANILIKFGADTKIVDNKGQHIVWVPEQKGGNKIIGKRFV